MTNESERARALGEQVRFQELPDAIREWILASPQATDDFATFFEKGGKVLPDEDVRLPSYAARQPPLINVNAQMWESLKTPGASEWGQRALFGQLAHEIGHDRFNTGSVPFTGTTADEYVQYRARLEAQAIFNAFPIFKDLEKHPDFRQQFPFNDIGYVSGLELGQLYKEWDAGKLTDKAVVDRITARIPERPYTLGSLQDQDADGKLTHRDAYLRDYSLYIAPRQTQASNSADSPMSESLRAGVAGLDKQAGKGWDDASDRMFASLLVLSRNAGFGPEDKLQIGFNLQTGKYKAGELIHVERSGPGLSPDPAANRAWVPTTDALATPAQDNLRKAESITPPAPAMALDQQALTQNEPSQKGQALRMG